MAKTQLNMELIYKGKVLDYIKSGSGLFQNKWYLGSNKHLLWQILDPSFPDKVQLISQKNNNFVMSLMPKTSLECKIDGKPVTKEQLASRGLLRGNQLTLQSNMTGVVTLSPDWQINYRFIEPYVHVLTEEQRQIVAQYSRRAERTPQEKAGTALILGFLFITLALLMVYDLVLKPDILKQYTVESSLESLRRAQRIEADRFQVAPQSAFDDEAAARAAAEAAAKAATKAAAKPKTPAKTTPGATGVAGGTASRFGSFDPGATARNIVAITESRTFVASTRGGTGTAAGGGSGPRPGGGTAGGIASTYDPNAVVNYNPGDLAGASSGTGLKGSTSRPAGGVEVVADINKAQIAQLNRPIAQTGQERQSISAISALAPAVTENTITSVSAEQRPGYQAVQNVANSNKSKLISAYRRHAAIQRGSGTVDIRILGRNGRVEVAEVMATSGTLSNDYLEEVKRVVSGWRIPGFNGPFNYKFTIRLSS